MHLIWPPRPLSSLKYLKFILILFNLIILLYLPQLKASTTDTEEAQMISRLAKEPDNLKIRSELSIKYYKNKNYEKTISILDPYSSELGIVDLKRLALAFKKTKNFKNESRVLKLILSKKPNDYQANLMLGESLLQQNLLTESIEALRAVIKIKPNVEKAYLGLLDIFKTQKNNYEAQIVLNDLVKKFGKKKRYTSEQCRLYTEDAYLEQAIETCKEAIKQDPNNDENYVFLTRCYLDNEDPKTAEKMILQSTKKFSRSPKINVMAGKYYFDLNNYNVSQRHYLKAIKEDNNLHEAQLGVARSSFLLGKFDISLSGFVAACKLDSKNTLKYFKESVTKLRLDGNYHWENKFNSSLYRCM
jgi:tetratricopeptide (TPR) repeat protein